MTRLGAPRRNGQKRNGETTGGTICAGGCETAADQNRRDEEGMIEFAQKPARPTGSPPGICERNMYLTPAHGQRTPETILELWHHLQRNTRQIDLSIAHMRALAGHCQTSFAKGNYVYRLHEPDVWRHIRTHRKRHRQSGTRGLYARTHYPAATQFAVDEMRTAKNEPKKKTTTT